jgi:hypothetical protein
LSREILIKLSEDNDSLFLVKKSNGLTHNTTITKSQLDGLFGNDWETGVMPCSGSGIIYIKNKGNMRLLVTQQTHTPASIKQFRIGLGDDFEEKSFSTPNTLMFHKIEITGSSSRCVSSAIVLTKNPVMSLDDEIFSAFWLWNVSHNEFPESFYSNICWGDTVSWNSYDNTSLSPYVSAISHFYTQAFTPDYECEFDMWEQYTETRRFESDSFGTIRQAIERDF